MKIQMLAGIAACWMAGQGIAQEQVPLFEHRTGPAIDFPDDATIGPSRVGQDWPSFAVDIR